MKEGASKNKYHGGVKKQELQGTIKQKEENLYLCRRTEEGYNI